LTLAAPRAPVPGAPGAPVVRAWLIDFVLLAAIWGSSFLFMRLAVVDFGPFATAGVRVLIAALFLLPIMLWRGHGAAFKQHWRPVLLVGMMNSGIPFACFCFALLYITTGLSAILNATVPLFGAIVAWVWLKDRPSTSRLVGLAVGFVGVALLASDKASFKTTSGGHDAMAEWGPTLAVAACLTATLCYALSASFTKRYLGGLPSLVTATGSQMGATLILALPTVAFWPDHVPGMQAWVALLVVGVVCTGLAYVLYFRIIERAGPAKALAVTFVVPVFAVFYGVTFLGEQVSLWMLLCAVVIVCGTALSTGLLKFPPSR
jgi:drug/metabolite transporter (DMT)-like permease